jgi:hypothetical protein
MSLSRTIRLSGLCAALLLTGCMETMPKPERPERPRPPQAGACTREYAPVCAAKGWRRQTVSNSCEAERKGFTVIKQGPCGDK